MVNFHRCENATSKKMSFLLKDFIWETARASERARESMGKGMEKDKQTPCWGQSLTSIQDPETMTWAETKSQTITQEPWKMPFLFEMRLMVFQVKWRV